MYTLAQMLCQTYHRTQKSIVVLEGAETFVLWTGKVKVTKN